MPPAERRSYSPRDLGIDPKSTRATTRERKAGEPRRVHRLKTEEEREQEDAQQSIRFPAPATTKPSHTTFVAVLVLGLALILYIGHVHATDALLAKKQRLERERRALQLEYNRVKGLYDQMTSPAVIYEHAQTLGLTSDTLRATYHLAPREP